MQKKEKIEQIQIFIKKRRFFFKEKSQMIETLAFA